ncbi:MAG: hypothetical protein KA419_14055 [Acidobacteria bacterium]|nr:hypothetical protein [Acidobacteriota bacterium]
MKRLLIIGTVMLVGLPWLPADSWTELFPPTVPPARYGHTLTRVGDVLYLFGGRGNPPPGAKPGPELNDIWSFNNDLFEGIDATAPPPVRFGHGAAGSGGKLWVAFGFGDLSTRGDAHAFDPAAGSWAPVTAGSVPARSFPALAPFPDGSLYLFGGLSSDGSIALPDLWRFSPGTSAWSVLLSMPGTGRYGAMGFQAGGKLYVFGGDDMSAYSSALWVFDPASGAWSDTMASNPPPARAFGAVASSGDRAWVFGGEDAAGNPLQDTWEYSVAGNAWTRKTDLPLPLAGAAAAMRTEVGSPAVLVFGGRGLGGLAMAKVFLYRPDGSPAGDINGDGVVDAADYLLLATFLSGVPSQWGFETPEAADVNGDGALDAMDLVALLLLLI